MFASFREVFPAGKPNLLEEEHALVKQPVVFRVDFEVDDYLIEGNAPVQGLDEYG